MAMEWVAPISTAVVGIAGVFVASLISARAQRHQLEVLKIERSFSQDDRLWEAKRAAYAEFLALLHDFEVVAEGTASCIRAIQKGEQPEWPSETVGAKVHELDNRSMRVYLVANSEVSIRLAITLKATGSATRSALDGGRALLEGEIQVTLVHAMAKDLGFRDTAGKPLPLLPFSEPPQAPSTDG